MKLVLRLVLVSGLGWLPTASWSQPVLPADLMDRAYRSSAHLDSASYYVRRAVVGFTQRREPHRRTHALQWLGHQYLKADQLDSARHYLGEALWNLESNPTPDTLQAATYYRLGQYHDQTQQPLQAIQMFEKALYVQKKIGSPAQLVETCVELARLYRYKLFDYLTAEEYYHRALTLFNQADLQDISFHFRILYSLATTNRLKQDYEKALTYGYQAVGLAKNLAPKRQEICYTMLGNIYDDQGNHVAAVQHYRQALGLGVARLGAHHSELAIRYNNLAAILIKTDSLVSGIRLLRRVQQMYLPPSTATVDDHLADTYQHLGDAYRAQAQPDSALGHYHRSYRINRQIFGFKHPLTAQILLSIGQLHRQQQAYDSALYYFQQALMANVPDFNPTDITQHPTVAMMQHDPLSFDLLYHKGIGLLDMHDDSEDTRWLPLALTCFARTDSLIDSCRVMYDREESKLDFLSQTKAVYEAAVDCTYRLYEQSSEEGYLDWAFRFMEKSKAVVLWEALLNSQMKHSVGVPDSLLRQDQSLNAELAYTNSELFRNTKLQRSDTGFVTELRKQQFLLSRQREILNQYLEEHHPEYFRIKYGQEHYTLKQAQAYARRSNTTLVEYLWGGEHLYAIGTTARNARFIRTPITATAQRALATVLDALRDPPTATHTRADFYAFTNTAHTLYRLLLAPLLEETPSETTELFEFFRSVTDAQRRTYGKSLTIVPDGPLSYLPFETLLTQPADSSRLDYRPLSFVIDRYSVNYAHSSQVLDQSQGDRPRHANRFLAFGYAQTPDAPGEPESGSWSGLPGTAQEVKQLSQMSEGTFYLGDYATEDRFKSEAERYDVIHLAVHGQVDTLNPHQSRLVFRTERDSAEDGSLYSYELYDLRLRADLAVLSACESGTGKLRPGEGVYSLARGFTYAGCPTVLMSLWKVDDRQTSRIMPTFYRGLYRGHSVADALRDAKLRYRQAADRYYAHPAFWSAFIVGGTVAPIISYRSTYRITWIIAVLSILYLGMTLYRARRAKRQFIHGG